ncbi:chitin deacetylase 7-like [Daphnia pulex]|uniref:chitin deacetylase 7-like n=1 Tax=Daphnia pulex TaxID=6669 RepID=UPI001EE0F7C9|nr:chitin deacetylase 7-like [Daphnia pulex]
MVYLFIKPFIFITILWEIQILTAETINSSTACDRQKCLLPDCLCMKTAAPNGLNPEEIPQMVFLTFDDAVADVMYPTYQRILHNRTNPNGCDIGMTLFVTHEGTNYRLVNELFNKGNEIASHTVTHKMDNDYWKNTSADFWLREVGYQRHLLHSYGNIPFDTIQGFRSPFLQTGGDATLTALRMLGMSYDSSFTTMQFMDPPVWPFTMDYECQIPPCGNESHPGFWSIPMIEFRSSDNGFQCKTADTCFPPYIDRPDKPEASNLTADEIFHYFVFNFNRFNKNRAPFGIHQHMYWFLNNEPILEGFLQFLDYLATLDYVYIVPISKGIEWMKNPKTLKQLKDKDVFNCLKASPAPCPKPQVCYYTKSVPGGARFMGTCLPCPAEYPWLPDQYDPLTTTTTRQTTPSTTYSTVPNNSASEPDSNNLFLHLILIFQGLLLSFLHFFC